MPQCMTCGRVGATAEMRRTWRKSGETGLFICRDKTKCSTRVAQVKEAQKAGA